ncbi:bifunctional diaminohydroxyphosphoribosylaminopyrimidine deaminase/5-amino-6-(5-phosphoribosylamino)uracil reductase RibD [soil metagenome]
MDDDEAMGRALKAASSVRRSTSPNPWVGAVVETPGGALHVGATEPPGGAHAEMVALRAAGGSARGGTLWCTLEPCSHQGRTWPCADAIIDAGMVRVVVGLVDPDPLVAGEGLARLRGAGIEVIEGVRSPEVEDQLAPYLRHRRTGRPWVVLKLAASLDGRTAAPDGSSRWITGPEARADAHRLRAESDAIVVGAGTVRADDPALTVRDGAAAGEKEPLRVVLGHAPPGARVQPALEHHGPVADLLEELGRRGVLQVLFEGGATVAGEIHRAGLVDRYVVYLAPVLFGGDDGNPLLAGPGAGTIDDVWRGRITATTRLGPDLRLDLEPVAGTSPVPASQGAGSRVGSDRGAG